MAFRRPTYELTIPSLYDGTRLECRLYHPTQLRKSDIPSKLLKGAMLAHPYAPLGGCFDDPVVNIVADELLKAGYIVGTFNMRGVGSSQGRTSWTGKPELGDFTSFFSFLVFYIVGLNSGLRCTPDALAEIERVEDDSSPPDIIVAGYSYGSMLATYLPSLNSIQEVFQDCKEIDASTMIIKEAQNFSNKWNAGLEGPGDLTPIDALRDTSTNISYLLISPILPPISYFTATAVLTSTLTTTLQGRVLQPQDLDSKVIKHRTLAIYGDKDDFTSFAKLKQWSDKLRAIDGSQYDSIAIKDAGHFWHKITAESQMRSAIQKWITQE